VAHIARAFPECAMILAAALSSAIGIGPWKGKPRLLMNSTHHLRIFPRYAAASISASVEFSAITSCLWAIGTTGVPPISIDHPILAILSCNPPGRFASTRHSVTGGAIQFTSPRVADTLGFSCNFKSIVWNKLLQLFHFDIHNSFQTCPDTSPEAERTWLQINQTWLDYYRKRHPTKWPVIEALIQQGYHPEQFAVEMFMFVQGQTDASRKWGEMVEDFLFNKIGQIANQANLCTYSGIYKGKPVILCQATDDFLLFCEDQAPYDAMILDFRKKWTVHALDEVKIFFGI
jgi:hypothetical protein